jgi:hypothetical protein
MLNLKSIIQDLSAEQINQVVASGIRAGKHTSGNTSTNTNSGGSMSTGTNTGTDTNTGTGMNSYGCK